MRAKAGVALAFIASLLSISACVARPGDSAQHSGSSSPPASASPTRSSSPTFDRSSLGESLYFSDWQSGARFEVYLTAIASQSSSISFYEPGLGLVWTTGQLTIATSLAGSADPTSNPSGSDNLPALAITYSGPGTLSPGATVDPIFTWPVASGPTSAITLSVAVALGAGHTNATAQVSIGNGSYNATSYGHPPAVDTTVAALVDDLARDDWGAVYDMAASVLSSSISRDQNLALAAAYDTGTISVTTSSPITYLSMTYPAAQVTLTMTNLDKTGATVTTHPVATFIWQQNGWRLMNLLDPTLPMPPVFNASPTP